MGKQKIVLFPSGFIPSIVLGLYFSVAAINQAFLEYIPKVAGLSLMSFLYLGFGAVLLLSVASNIFKKSVINPNAIFCLLFVSLLYGITALHFERTTLDFIEFLIYVFLPILFVSCVKVNVKVMIIASIIAPCVTIFNINSIFALREYTNNISMGTSYAFLFPIICTVAYLFKYFKKESLSKKIVIIPFLIINFIAFVFIFLHGSRGPLLCVAIVILLLATFEVKDNNGIRMKNKISFIFISISLLIVIAFIWEILSGLNAILLRNGYDVNFIRKLLELKSENDVLNGRNVEYSSALQGIWDKPFFGHGMSSFTYYTGYAYPHNFLLQLAYDGGLLVFIMFLIPFIKGFYRFAKQCNSSEFVFGVVLFAYAIPSSLFTGDLWKKPILWGLFAFLLFFVDGKKSQIMNGEVNIENARFLKENTVSK